MNKEIEQKKEYFAPKMEVIEMDHEATLLGGSPNNDENVDVGFEG